jgi:hypothetical protein
MKTLLMCNGAPSGSLDELTKWITWAQRDLVF